MQDLLALINNYLKQIKKSDPATVYREIDVNDNGDIDLQEFLTYFLKLKRLGIANANGREDEFRKKMTDANLVALFGYLDFDEAGALDHHKFGRYIGSPD